MHHDSADTPHYLLIWHTLWCQWLTTLLLVSTDESWYHRHTPVSSDMTYIMISMTHLTIFSIYWCWHTILFNTSLTHHTIFSFYWYRWLHHTIGSIYMYLCIVISLMHLTIAHWRTTLSTDVKYQRCTSLLSVYIVSLTHLAIISIYWHNLISLTIVSISWYCWHTTLSLVSTDALYHWHTTYLLT